jgi:hypothetical protein
MENEAFYKMQALQARRVAERLGDDDARRAWLEIAEHYDALAESARTFQTCWKPN